MQPVKPDLLLLIRELEKEQRTLKKMVRQAAAEADNLIVYYHSEALLDINRRLHVLCSFNDPLFQQKEELKRQIGLFRKGDFFKKMRPELRGRMKSRYEQKALELEKQLQQLMDRPLLPEPGTRFIDEALSALYEKRCRSFQLKFGDDDDKESQTVLTFKIKRNALAVYLKGQSGSEQPDFVFDGRIPKPLLAAGFVYDEQRKTFTRTFDLAGYQTLPEIKKWLGKFIIEDCWYYWPGRKMALVYK
jgi:hypothetical protein